MSYPLYGNAIIDSSNSTALGGTLTISNSCNTSVLNNRASIAFAVADISYGTLNRGLFSGGVDSADVRITAMVDTVSPTVGTGLSLSVSPNHSNPPVEALRVQSNGNVGIGTQTPQFTLDVNGNLNVAGNAIFNNDLTLNQTKIHLGTGSGVTNQGDFSICIGANAGASNMPINSIQINATGTNISSQTTASSCVIAPIRLVDPPTTQLSLPLLYNTTTNEVFNPGEDSITVNLNATRVDLGIEAYNRFIFINSIATAGNGLRIPSPAVNYRATITLFNNNNPGRTYTLSSAKTTGAFNIGGIVTDTISPAGSGCITLQTNGSVWCRIALG